MQEYIAMGLENNLVLQKNTLSFKNAGYLLKVAKGLLLPEAIERIKGFKDWMNS